MQKSTFMGSLREKEGQHPVLEVYFFHKADMYVSLYRAPLTYRYMSTSNIPVISVMLVFIG